MNKQFDEMIKQGYLRSQEKGDLIVYNYTEQAQYGKVWNDITLNARGTIYNKKTGEIVARAYKKFFNLGEVPETRLENLPNEPYEVLEKADGSLGILRKDESGWQISTRGSFDSEQAIRATAMFNKRNKNTLGTWTAAQVWDTQTAFHNYTLLFEIIYPENRVNPGARLVVDYGSTETLILLAAIDKETGIQADYDLLKTISYCIEFPVVKRYDYTIEQMIELQKTLPKTQEGFVVKYKSGLLVKIKGEEYCRYHRILNNITPLFFWELMKETSNFELLEEYKASIPEEILPEMEEIERKLKLRFSEVMEAIELEFAKFLSDPKRDEEFTMEKQLGLWIKSTPGLNHSRALFSYLKNDVATLRKLVCNTIRPTSNVL